MKFSEIGTGAPVQSQEEEDTIKASLPLIISILERCGLDRNKFDDAIVLDIVIFHWIYHFSTRLEIGSWTSEDITFLFLKLTERDL